MGQHVGCVVPAAGTGARFGDATQKVLVPLAGCPLLLHTLRTLEQTPSIGPIIIVAHPNTQDRIRRMVRTHRLRKPSAIVPGGSTRAESVARGVAALPPKVRWVVIHDGARPCVTRRLIASSVTQARRCGAVACGLPASVTVKAVDHDKTVRLTLDRDGLWFVQTPQAFRIDWLREAYATLDHALEAFPDDAALLEHAGFRVTMIPGDPLNIKVTTKEDLLLAEAILKSRVHWHLTSERVR